MKRLFYILFFVALSSQSFTQTFADKKFYLVDSLDLEVIPIQYKSLIDSCLKVFHTTKLDTTKIKALNEIINEVFVDNVWPKYNDVKLKIIEKLLQNTNDSLLQYIYMQEQFLSLYNKAYYFESIGDYKNALKHYLIELKAAKKIGKAETADALNSIGFFYKKNGNITSALKYYHQSLVMFEKTDDRIGEARLLNNIGVVYMLQDNISQCLEYFHKSLKIRQKINNKFGIAESFNNIGYVFHYYGDPSCKEKMTHAIELV